MIATTIIAIIGVLALVFAAIETIRPRPFNPQLKEPHDWTRGGDDAS